MSAVYGPQDWQRRFEEGPKGSQLVTPGGLGGDGRGPFARDRARVLHSAALRRLADKTQVVGPHDGDTPRTRLTHSLEVAQIARGIGQGLGLDADLCEMAGLTHDIGHPPYGHNGEKALDQISDCGFEGNAQTLRILTRLEPKVLVGKGLEAESFGLNLTRAALDAACKYPRTRTAADGQVNRKYGCYDEDAEILTWIRQGHSDERPSMEAQAMDFSDDIAYSVHDVEDGIVSGRINLSVLWDFVELAELADKGARAFGGVTPEQLIAAADGLRELQVVGRAADFDATLTGFVNVKAMTSELVGRYVGAVVEATRQANSGQIGRVQGNLVVPEQVLAEVTLLKTIAVLYVMDNPIHLQRQDHQRDRIAIAYEYLMGGAPGALDPMFRLWWEQANTDLERERVVVDQIASMTESRLERLVGQAAGLVGYIT
ncbi:deoxyguanosinetriphosphate triphosphohydrolase [Corynebacterium sp. 153RC1]|uniref:deoxyguanosinetriphosphate triphosphohydrolase n=1 Tax=unclassified Corynebacterium TaxID=2624378 RepID=UPI00211BFB01|nr:MULTISPECIES: deoxyguanosinetriphosphate triphosphohydrolase [unclassified Corynebacterium]MCQ9352344.1 deoxyguanosinetriphosphate triphosphohydrolase [Corynebacterium sp. 209RC1]MCQ9354266.1 deoxyguanosinetriphosphate triphosphohydrolase [Corynebacterium sp. 1222RC1]MCQ9356548.1 deoxyguanosinetriphosphate triphosphohydrolase [Corynebacterium sp. 122RC1]MCQ9358868.1 deoxyguanosinetriphosphate triphosphohydrolase [Corynebacterium sp. 142RC1]MCQ9360500.1 deoxyguanosinetriphosphate triphosphoh